MDIMAEYIEYFHENLVDLTGTVEQIEAVKAEYRVYAAKADNPVSFYQARLVQAFFAQRNKEIN